MARGRGHLRRLIPPGLQLDLYQGQAWIGVVPFRMSGVRPRYFPRLPGLHAFPELNVRTYVVRNGIPGVWFFSLDAANPVAVRAARRFFHLPYFDADMRATRTADGFDYSSHRTHRGAAPAALETTWIPNWSRLPRGGRHLGGLADGALLSLCGR